MSSVEIDSAAFEKDLNNYLETSLPNGIENGLKAACLLVENSAKAEVRKDLGQLAGSIRSDIERSGNEINGYVSANTEYALFYHEGTGIYAKNGNGRKTPWTYIDRHGNRVRTVGQKPKPFLKNAVENNKDKINQIIQNSLK